MGAVTFSRIIAGTMTWGSWGKKLSKNGMIQLMNHCIEQGITSFDHADIYGGYTTEEDFGHAYAESGIDRSKVEIITKCGIQYTCDKRPNKVKHYNYSKDYIIWSAEESLKNLKTDYLDLFLLHRPSPLMVADEIAEAITLLKKQGKIRDFGVSNFTPSQTALIQREVPVSFNQIEFSITAFEAMSNGSLDHMVTNSITPMAWSPLGTVFREESKQTNRITKLLTEFMVKYNATADQLLLAWTLKHPAEIHPVIGTTSENRIENAVKALEIDMELEDWFLLLEASQGHPVA